MEGDRFAATASTAAPPFTTVTPSTLSPPTQPYMYDTSGSVWGAAALSPILASALAPSTMPTLTYPSQMYRGRKRSDGTAPPPPSTLGPALPGVSPVPEVAASVMSAVSSLVARLSGSPAPPLGVRRKAASVSEADAALVWRPRGLSWAPLPVTTAAWDAAAYAMAGELSSSSADTVSPQPTPAERATPTVLLADLPHASRGRSRSQPPAVEARPPFVHPMSPGLPVPATAAALSATATATLGTPASTTATSGATLAPGAAPRPRQARTGREYWLRFKSLAHVDPDTPDAKPSMTPPPAPPAPPALMTTSAPSLTPAATAALSALGEGRKARGRGRPPRKREPAVHKVCDLL